MLYIFLFGLYPPFSTLGARGGNTKQEERDGERLMLSPVYHRRCEPPKMGAHSCKGTGEKKGVPSQCPPS